MNNKSLKNQNFFKKYFDLFIFLFTAALFFVLQFFNLFEKVDYRLYDGMLALRPEPAESKNIVLIDADNKSIQDLGEWPWSRDIVGDTLLRLKEFGTDTAVFDIEYLSPSSKGVPSNVEKTISDALQETYDLIDSSIIQLSDGIKNNYFKMKELPGIIEDSVVFALNDSMTNLDSLLTHNIYRDNDEYLSKCLEFFQNAWMTVNICDISILYEPEDIHYVKERFLWQNIIDENSLIKINNQKIFKKMYGNDKQAFCPALPKIIKGANGAGFTNVTVDSDGSRRRIELLYDIDGKFLGQLVFAPLLKYLDVQNVIRENNKLILKQANFPNKDYRVDIKIPLDENGTMLINWLHKPYIDSFTHISFSDLKRLDILEEVFVNNFEYLYSFGLLDENGNNYLYADKIESILYEYSQIKSEKIRLLDLCNGINIDGTRETEILPEDYENYFNLRKNFYNDFFDFVNNQEEYKEQIINRLTELKDLGEVSSDDYDFVIPQIEECFAELLRNKTEFETETVKFEEMLSGKFAILGNTASSTTDMGATPFISRYENVGCHANVLNTILQRDFIDTISWIYIYCIGVVVFIVLIVLLHKKSLKMQNIVYAIFTILLILVPYISMIFFSVYMQCFALILLLILNYFIGLSIRFRNSAKEKKFIRQAFSTYVSKDVVNEIIKDPSKALKLGGEEKNITALFTDIRKFSTFSELVTPEKLVSILNDYLGVLSDVILDNKGTIDKYIGDAIVSFFGAPLPLENHAYKACISALGMKKAEDEFNAKFLMDNDITDERFEKYFSEGLYSRIGINTGKMVAGNMGTTGKMNYTAMGNDMNLASRLEGVNKKYESKILISDKTWNEANSGENENKLVVRKVDKVRVVGINTPIQLYNLIGFRSELSNKKLEQIDVFHEGLDLYLKKDFKNAEKAFMRSRELDPSDETALIFVKTCQDYIQNGIPEDWDGIINLTSK